MVQRGAAPRAAVALLAVTLLAMPVARADLDPTDLGDPALQARYSTLTHELRCMQCQFESLADSPVELAAEMRSQIAQMVKAGKSDDEVLNYMRSRYGDFILFKPRSPLLWGAPVLLLAIGAAVAWNILRQRRGLLETDTEPLEEEV